MAGKKLQQISQVLDLSCACVRKWWRLSTLPNRS